MFNRIITAFSCTRSGLAQANYAADLSQQLGSELHLTVPGLQEENLEQTAERLVHCHCKRIGPALKKALSERTAKLAAHGALVPNGHDLLVGGDRRLMPATANWLCSYDEEKVSSLTSVPNAGPPLLLPFGDTWETAEQTLSGLELAKSLGSRVILYHTTWREENLGDAPPLRHMCGDARTVLCRLIYRSVEINVAYEILIECADDVAQGTVRAALRLGCGLIVMARGKRSVRGSYVDQIIQRSTVPVLVFGRKEV